MDFQWILSVLLIIAALLATNLRDLLSAVIVFAAYSLAMALAWQQLEAPDIAITEAAIGAGVTTLMFIAAISRTRRYEE